MQMFKQNNIYTKNKLYRLTSFVVQKMSDLARKVEDLETIVKNQPQGDNNKELISVMRTLAKISDQLKKEKEYINNIEKQNYDLKQQVQELKDTIEKRDYQIIVLSNNLRQQLYK